MARVLIVYGTTEGHTRKIAEHIGVWLREIGLAADLVDSSEAPQSLDFGVYELFIMAGSLHETNHQRSLTQFVRANADSLHPSAFLSVSLTAINKDEKHLAQAHECMNKFYEHTGWKPEAELPVAGALKYLEYNFLKRMLMRMISEKEGGPTDVTRDYEFTDWAELKQFVTDFANKFARVTT